MDLNYLFYRQQIERSMAEAAGSPAARKIHEQLATSYEARIGRAAWTPDAQARPFLSWVTSDPTDPPKANATMAVAITAREVGED